MGCFQSKNKKGAVLEIKTLTVAAKKDEEKDSKYKRPRKTNVNETFEVEKNWQALFKKLAKDPQKLKWANLIHDCIWGEVRYRRPFLYDHDFSDCSTWIMNVTLLRTKRPAPVENPEDGQVASGWKELTVKDYNYFQGTVPASERDKFDHPPRDPLIFMRADDFSEIGVRKESELKAPIIEPASMIMCESIKEDTGDVTWGTAYDLETVEEALDFNEKQFEQVEQCIIMAKHTFFRPGASGAHGKIPQYPMHLMRGSIIKTIDASKPFAIPKHEQALEQGMLVGLEQLVLVRGEEPGGLPNQGRLRSTRPYKVPMFKLAGGLGYLAGPLHRIVFVSHRWLSPNYQDWTKAHPDDAENSKLKVLQDLIKDDDFVFFDFWSIPQEAKNDENRMKAIASLMTYVDFSSVIFAICPTPQNRLEYDERGWTNLELLAGLVPVSKRQITNKWNTEEIWGHSVADIRFVDGSGHFSSLSRDRLKNPFTAIFGVPRDLELIAPIVNIIRESCENLQKAIKLYEDEPSYASKVTFQGVCDVKYLVQILTKQKDFDDKPKDEDKQPEQAEQPPQ